MTISPYYLFLDFITLSFITLLVISFITFVYINSTRRYTFGRGLFSLIFGFLDFIFLSLVTAIIVTLLFLIITFTRGYTFRQGFFSLIFFSLTSSYSPSLRRSSFILLHLFMSTAQEDTLLDEDYFP